MNCPECGLYHPSRYDQCVSCGCKFKELTDPQASSKKQAFQALKNKDEISEDEEEQEQAANDLDDQFENNERNLRKDRRFDKATKGGLPFSMGITLVIGILLASAGGTFFFLSRPPESERLLQEGLKQLNNGQYAFAQKTLEQAMSVKPNDPKVLLALARAYVGTDQVEKAGI